MLLPIRCYSCNKVLGNKSLALEKYRKEGKEKEGGYCDFFREQGIHRYCCKKVIMSSLDLYPITNDIRYPRTIEVKKVLETLKICIAR
jgi:DNA-directed RNA polymerase subunit N (RpoN/RPB10)